VKRSAGEDEAAGITTEAEVMEAVILIGIQGSGKSTFYRERFFDTHVRISLDLLRTRNREKLLLRACLEGKQSFVIDNTNVTAADRQRYIVPAKESGFIVTGYYFSSRLDEALARNRPRTGKQCIPDKVIAGTYKRLELPGLDEGFDRLYYVRITGIGQFVVEEWRDEFITDSFREFRTRLHGQPCPKPASYSRAIAAAIAFSTS
jgi:predicted kinase